MFRNLIKSWSKLEAFGTGGLPVTGQPFNLPAPEMTPMPREPFGDPLPQKLPKHLYKTPPTWKLAKIKSVKRPSATILPGPDFDKYGDSTSVRMVREPGLARAPGYESKGANMFFGAEINEWRSLREAQLGTFVPGKRYSSPAPQTGDLPPERPAPYAPTRKYNTKQTAPPPESEVMTSAPRPAPARPMAKRPAMPPPPPAAAMRPRTPAASATQTALLPGRQRPVPPPMPKEDVDPQVIALMRQAREARIKGKTGARDSASRAGKKKLRDTDECEGSEIVQQDRNRTIYPNGSTKPGAQE